MLSALTLIAIAFTVGIAVGEWLSIGAWSALALALAGTGGVAAALVRGRALGVAALALAFAVGVLACAGARPRAPPGLLDGAAWDIEAEVASAPERSFGTTRVPVELRAVEREGARRTATGRVLVLVGGELAEPLLVGDLVRFTAELRAPRGFVNPGPVDSARRAAADHVLAVAGVHAPAALSRLARAPSTWLRVRRLVERLLGAWRARMSGEVAARLDGDRRALVRSLVVGDRGDVSRELDDAFRVAGVSHVLSVSGLHLAIAAFLFYAGVIRLLLRLPRVGRGRPVRRWAALAALPATVAYTIVTGAQVATVRACVVACVWLVGVALGRRAAAEGALATAALLLLGDSPLELFDPSFQLSFAASIGTALVAPRWMPRGLVDVETSGATRLAKRAIAWVVRLAAASAAAILATLPIGAWHFAQLAPAGIFSNLVVVPLAEMGVVPVGLSGCALASAHLPLGGALISLAGLGAGAMGGFVRWFASWAPSWRVPAPSLVELSAWYVGLGAIAIAGRRARWLVAGCALVVAGSLAVRWMARATSTTLTATFLDVGQGDACVVELPHGRVAVIDGGGSFDPSFDPGEQVIAPFLWRRGIRRIDLLVLSHPHPDHANGLGFLVESFAVGEVWTNGAPTTQPGTVHLLQAAAARGAKVGAPRPLELGGALIEPLAPLGPDGALALDPAASENDSSLVVGISWRGRRLLFAGDLEAEGEAALLSTGRAVAADVLKVPHHGSRTSSSAPFLAAVRPQLAVISVGERNRWGFPDAGVLERYDAIGARVLRTDRDGAVAIHVGGDGRLTSETMR
jgi:competence protein ComEC